MHIFNRVELEKTRYTGGKLNMYTICTELLHVIRQFLTDALLIKIRVRIIHNNKKTKVTAGISNDRKYRPDCFLWRKTVEKRTTHHQRSSQKTDNIFWELFWNFFQNHQRPCSGWKDYGIEIHIFRSVHFFPAAGRQNSAAHVGKTLKKSATGRQKF